MKKIARCLSTSAICLVLTAVCSFSQQTVVFPGNSLSGSFGAWGGTGHFYSPTFNANAAGGIDITYYDIDVSQFTEGNVWSLKGVALPGVSKQNTMTSIDPQNHSVWCNILNMEVASGTDWNGNSISTLGPDGIVRTTDDTRHQGTQDWYRPATGGKIDGPAAGPYYNNESYVIPNPRFLGAPAKTASELNSYDFRLRILPTEPNAYTYEMWFRMHNAASNIEGCPYCACGVYNHAMNNCGSVLAWRKFSQGAVSVFPISDLDLSSVYVFMGLGNYQDPASQSLTWGRIEATGTPTSPPSVVWVDDNYVAGGTNDGHVWGYDAFATIQGGVNAVATGGTVNVAAGIYTEQVNVAENLTLRGAGPLTIIKSPASLTGYLIAAVLRKPIVYVHGATATVERLTVDGDGKGNANTQFMGVAFADASGTIDSLLITKVRNEPLSGAQYGVAIYVRNTDGLPRTVDVTNNTITGFQKNGMALLGSNLSVNVSNNVVTGAGPTGVTAQNGIQVGNGAGGMIGTNNSISDVSYTGPTWTASGILVSYNNAVTVEGNIVRNAQTGVYAYEGDATINANTIEASSAGTGTEAYYGILIGDPDRARPSPFDSEEGPPSSGTSAPTGPTLSAVTMMTALVNSNMIIGSGGTDHVALYAFAGYFGEMNVDFSACGNKISGWDYGILIDQCSSGCTAGLLSSALAKFNCISQNGMGMYNSGLDPALLTAEHNWWGSATGPSHLSNPGGIGDPVSDDVDFDPWLSELAYLGTPQPLTSVVLQAMLMNCNSVGVEGVMVKFFVDDTFIGSDITDESGIASYSLGAYPVGVYNVDVEGIGGCMTGGGLLAVYDPSAGFVTGGGWIMSLEGAYPADPSLTGKATFGFVSKYQKGRTVPTGNTEFQFKVANLNFSSTSYDWLVIAGPKAQYKGLGTINGSGNFGFMLTAIDGQINGGGGTDKFRIKIWNRSNGDAIVYDNQIGAEDGSDPTTVISGGSIVIHKGGSKKDGPGDVVPTIFTLEPNYPNPFNPTTTIRFGFPIDGNVTLGVFDVLGRRVTQLVEGREIAGFHDVEFDASNLSSGVYFYRMYAIGDDGRDFTAVQKMLLTK